MFYIILFSAIAILCIVAGATAMTRNRRQLDAEDEHHASAGQRSQRKAQRAQSSAARRKRK
jgi:hypothetical protein